MNLIKVLFLSFCVAFVVTACKVSYSFTGGTLSPEVKTFSVQFFPNRAPLVNPNLSNQFTEALKEKFRGQTTLDENTFPSQNFTGEKVITVIDSRQARLQKIITTLMGKFKSIPDAYVHLGYESVTLSSETAKILGLDTDGKQAQMSGRKGLYVNADSVYDLLKKRTIEETTKRHSEMDSSEIEKIAHSVSVGTLRYEMIKQDLDKIIAFDLTKSLSLDGDTAPYIQYTHARSARILEKSKRTPSIDVDFSLLKEPSELDLIKTIGLFDMHVRDAANNLSPKVIARYCHDLAVTFNSFYENVKVLELGDEALENSRLCIVN